MQKEQLEVVYSTEWAQIRCLESNEYVIMIAPSAFPQIKPCYVLGGGAFTDIAEAHVFCDGVNGFISSMFQQHIEAILKYAGESTFEKELNPETSKWTMIYHDFANKDGLFPYIRMTPGFMDLEAAGRSHGLSISPIEMLSKGFQTKDEAKLSAEAVDAYLGSILRMVIETHPDRYVIEQAMVGKKLSATP